MFVVILVTKIKAFTLMPTTNTSGTEADSVHCWRQTHDTDVRW